MLNFFLLWEFRGFVPLIFNFGTRGEIHSCKMAAMLQLATLSRHACESVERKIESLYDNFTKENANFIFSLYRLVTHFEDCNKYFHSPRFLAPESFQSSLASSSICEK